jgi:cell division topological specificity factor
MFKFTNSKSELASPRNVAKNRLKGVLSNDRTDCPPQLLEMMRLDIANVIESYFNIDTKQLTLKISRTNDNPSLLVASVPLSENKK